MPVHFNVYPSKVYYDAHTKDEINAVQESLQVADHNAMFRAKHIMKMRGYVSDEEQERIIQYTKWIRFYDGRTKTFGTGLLPIVKKKLRKLGVEYAIHEKRKPLQKIEPKNVRFFFKDRFEERPEQLESLKQAIKHGSGILSCATNSGKTDIAAGIISVIKKHTRKTPTVLFLVHRISLVEQTAKRFQRHLEIPITKMGGGLKKVGKVTVTTFQTARGLQNSHNKEFKEFLKNCDIVFVDELHTNSAKSVQRVMEECQARMRFGLSGTISRKKLRLFKYMSMTGPIISEIKSQELIKLGRSAKPTIRFLRVDYEVVSSQPGYAKSYQRGIVEHENRNSKIVKEVLRYLDKGMKNVMVVVSRIHHGRELLRRFEQTDLPVDFIHGGTPMDVRKRVTKKFAKNKLPILIVSPIFNEGVDLPAIRSAVMAGGGLSWELTLQRLGRTLRRKVDGDNVVWVTDFLDFHNKHLLKHSLKRFKYYQDEGLKLKIIKPKRRA